MDILSFQWTTMTLVSLPQTALTVLHSYCLLDKNDQDTQPAKCSCFMTTFSWEQPLVPKPSPKSCKRSPNPTPASYWGCSMVAHALPDDSSFINRTLTWWVYLVTSGHQVLPTYLLLLKHGWVNWRKKCQMMRCEVGEAQESQSLHPTEPQML